MIMNVLAVATVLHDFSVIDGVYQPYSDWAFLAVPGLGGGASNASPPLRFLKTIKYIDMKLTPLIKRRKINLLLLSYFSCDVT